MCTLYVRHQSMVHAHMTHTMTFYSFYMYCVYQEEILFRISGECFACTQSKNRYVFFLIDSRFIGLIVIVVISRFHVALVRKVVLKSLAIRFATHIGMFVL